MRQEYDENLLLGYVEGDLTEVDRARVEQWMAADPGLAKLLIGMAEDRAALRKLPDPPTPDWMLEDVDSGLERAMLLDDGDEQDPSVGEHKRNVLFRISTYGGVAAMLLLGAFFVVQPLFDLHPTHVAVDGSTEESDGLPGPEVALDHTPERTATAPDDDPALPGKGGLAPASRDQPKALTKKATSPRNDRALVGKGGPDAGEGDAANFAAQGALEPVNAQAVQNEGPAAMRMTEPVRPVEVAMANQASESLAGKVAGLPDPVAPELIEVVITTDDLAQTTRNISRLPDEFKGVELNRVAMSALQSRQRPVGQTDAEESVAVNEAADAVVEDDSAVAGSTTGAGPAPANLANNFQVYVPRDQAKAVLERLRAEADAPRANQARAAANAQVVVARRALTEVEQARYRSDLWPSYSPNYRAILQRAVPIDETQTPVARLAEQQLIEVIVEQRAADPAPATDQSTADEAVKTEIEPVVGD